MPYHKFVNTTPKPSATKNNSGFCVTLWSPVGVDDDGDTVMVGDGCVMAGSFEAMVPDGMMEEASVEEATSRAT